MNLKALKRKAAFLCCIKSLQKITRIRLFFTCEGFDFHFYKNASNIFDFFIDDKHLINMII